MIGLHAFVQARNRWRTNRVRAGHPQAAENIERVRVLLAKDRRLTAEEVGISKDTVGTIAHKDLES